MIVGWSMSETMTSRLVFDAKEMARHRRLPGAGLLTHTDRGQPVRQRALPQPAAGPRDRVQHEPQGNCWDNAVMESFFASLEKQLVHRECYRDRQEAKASLSEYIEVFYNRICLHSSLDCRSPAEYEKAL